MVGILNTWWFWLAMIVGPWVLNFVVGCAVGRPGEQRRNTICQAMEGICGLFWIVGFLAFLASIPMAIFGPLRWWHVALMFLVPGSWRRCARVWRQIPLDTEPESDTSAVK